MSPLLPRPLPPDAGESAEPGLGGLVESTLFSAAREASLVALFVLGFLAARLLGPAGYGQYGTALAFVGLFRFAAELGMPVATAIVASRDRAAAHRLFGEVLGLQLVVGSAAALACLLAGRPLLDGVTWTAVAILCADLLAGAFQTTLRWLLRTFDRFDLDALSLTLERVLILLAGAAALAVGGGVLALVGVVASIRVIVTLLLLAGTRRAVAPVAPAWSPATARAVLRDGLPLTLAAGWTLLAIQVDCVLLSEIAGPRDVALYRAPLRIAEGLMLVPRALTVALLPSLAARAALDPAALGPTYRRAARLLLLVALAAAAVGLALAEPIVLFLFGPEYGGAAGPARLAFAALVPLFLSSLAQTVLACVGRLRELAWLSLLALGVNAGLALLLVPSHGARGAAAATLLTLVVHAGLSVAVVSRAGVSAGWPALLPLPLACALASAAAARLARGWPVPLALAVAGLTWVAATLVLPVWDRRERDVVARLFAWTSRR